jgi:hypothetical protein
MNKLKSVTRLIAAGSVAAVVGLAGSAFTASNAMPADTQAGDGTRAITGYTVSNVHYGLNATNPENIDSVTFNLDSTPPAGSTMKIQLSAEGAWYSCTNVAAALTCPSTTPQATVAASDNLRVIVVD